MKIPSSAVFEIKVALIGNVSAGKTTILNALFRDKFGEVSMKRATAGVNFFRISRKSQVEDSARASKEEDAEPSNEKYDIESTSHHGENVRTADSILEEIKADNAVLRESKDSRVFCKTFDIELDFDVIDMRPDTTLTIVDIPGINEASCKGKYKVWVKANWKSFDCVIVVMDGRQGVNTEEQISLLNFVQENSNNIQAKPIIILCNKIDDPEDEEQTGLIKEARQEVESMFKVNDRETSLHEILTLATNSEAGEKPTSLPSEEAFQPYPVFLPVSGIFAFLFQCSSQVKFDRFRSFDKALLSKLGRDLIGKNKWRKLSEDERIEELYQVLADPKQHEESLAETNFDSFLLVLNFAIGGPLKQKQLIVAQIELSLKSAPCAHGITNYISSTYEKMAKVITLSKTKADESNEELDATSLLKEAFWRLFSACENKAFDDFTRRSIFSDFPLSWFIQSLVVPAEELIAYHKYSIERGWDDEKKIVSSRFKSLVQRQIGTLISYASTDKTGKTPSLSPWDSLSSLDWIFVFHSINLLSYDTSFCTTFGSEKLMIDLLISKYRVSCFSGDSFVDKTILQCPNCNSNLDFNRCCQKCSALICFKSMLKLSKAHDQRIRKSDIFGSSQAPAPSGKPASFSFGISTTDQPSGSSQTPAPSETAAPGQLFGSSPAPAPFGAPTASPFGISSTGQPFGSSSTPIPSGTAATGQLFDSSAAPAPFGKPASFSFGISTTDQPCGSSSTPAPPGTSAPGHLFGPFLAPTLFEASNSAAVCVSGEEPTPWQPTSRQDGSTNIMLQSISAMLVYERFSVEELRVKNYQNGNRPNLTSKESLPSPPSKQFPLGFCPRCHDSLEREQHSLNSLKCRKCSLRYIPFESTPPECMQVIRCTRCRKELDCNRWCSGCNIFYCLPDTITCPICPWAKVTDGRCHFCSREFQELPDIKRIASFKLAGIDQLLPADQEAFVSVCQVEVPDSISHPDHIGHLAWKYCEFIGSIDKI